MGLNILFHKASGRATCGVCDKKIEKGEVCVEFYGYQTSKQAHISCLVRGVNKVKFANGVDKNGV